jgi:hypothetical protein
MFTEADRVELHSAVSLDMDDLAEKASKGYALACLSCKSIALANAMSYVLGGRGGITQSR